MPSLVAADALLDSPPLISTDQDGDLFSSILDAWTPPKTQSLSEWAEENMVLSSEYSARTGPLRLYPFQRAMLDAFTDPEVREIVLMTSTQLIKTLMLQCVIAYIVAEDPGPILLLMPKEDAARKFSRTRLGPMIRDIEKLSSRISSSLHDGTATMLTKEFPGGSLIIASASTAIDVAAQTVRVVLSDEIDKYTTLKEEGDPNYLAWQRSATFGSRRKRVQTCSPTTKQTSRIGKAYRDSDQRKPYVPCPFCNTFQILNFFTVHGDDGTVGNSHSIQSTGGIWFDSSLPREESFKTARYLCVNKSCPSSHPDHGWTDVQRRAACLKVEWRASASFTGIAGFWISKLYSPYESMADLVHNFLRAKDDREKYRSFVNTDLAEEWEERGETPDHELLYERREDYPFGVNALVPQRACFLTCSVDVQQSPPRLEYEVVGWGRNFENWSVAYGTIQAYPKTADLETGQLKEDPTLSPLSVDHADVWTKFDLEVLQRQWVHESGNSMPIWVCCVDTGNMPSPVYKFARRKLQLAYSPERMRLIGPRTVVPIKGNDDNQKILSSVSKENATTKLQGVRIVMVGTHYGKKQLFSSLMHVRPVIDGSLSGAPTPSCHHFPQYDKNYFLGVTAEVLIVDKDGREHYEKRYPRNEPVDLKVYNHAAAELVGLSQFQESHWQAMERALKPVSVQGERVDPNSITVVDVTGVGEGVGEDAGEGADKKAGEVVDLKTSPAPTAATKPGASASAKVGTPGPPQRQTPASPAPRTSLMRPVSLPVRARF